jgi:ribosomal protein L24
VFVHRDDRVEVARGKFRDKWSDINMTRLESGMSFIQVKASMTMREKLRQVRSTICMN